VEKKSPTVVKLLNWIGPMAFGIVAAWGTAQFVSGQREQRLQTVEMQMKAVQDEHKNFATREEMRLYIENASEDLREIRFDIRDLRNSSKNNNKK
jgi:hypothetical protein